MLSVDQIAAVAANAGFSGDDLATAVAIALAESGGNPSAYNPESQAHAPSGRGSYGLWQIYLNVHPEFAGENLYDPQTNANAAFALYSQSGFSPWSTYKSGAYLSHMGSVTSVVASSATPSPDQFGDVVIDPSQAGFATADSLMPIAIAGLLVWLGLRIL